MRSFVQFRRSRRGAAAVEFAIICPLIFASVLGAFECGRALYELNRVSAACAAGARAASVTAQGDDDAIEAAVRAKFSDAQQDDVSVALSTETISGGDFQRIDVSYDHDFIVKLGPSISHVTLSATRYTPAG